MEINWKSIVPFIVLILAFFYGIKFRNKEQSPVVTISNGKIRGIVDTSRDGRDFYSYLGIPYAKVVTRFEPSQPADKWTDIKLTQHYGPSCTQVDNFSFKVVGEEDCLSINVHIPKNVDSNTLLPVIVYVHGGYFMTGGSTNHHPHYFMDENIVLVTFNYRVGALGFLSTQDGFVSGNMGLKDQVGALEWIKINVKQFGGDPNKVTIFGESAGAAAIHFHLLSPMSKGLFHRAISNSGTAIKIWSLSTKPKEQAKRLGQRLNCPSENSELLVNCLRNLSDKEIIQTQMETITPLLDPLIMYGPTVEVYSKDQERVFLPEHPYALMKAGKFHNVPWITGLNSEEGLLTTGRIAHDNDLMVQLENYDSALPLYLQTPSEDHDLTRQILQFYLPKKLLPDDKLNFTENFKALTDIMTDRNYLVATREAAIHHAKKSKVFMYYNKYQGDWSFTTFFGFKPIIPMSLQFIWKFLHRSIVKALNIKMPNDMTTMVCHGDDLFLLFKVPYMEIKTGSKDYQFSRLLVKTWVDFANHVETLTFNGIPWKPINVNTKNPKLEYLTFETSGEHGMKDEEFTKRAEFWHKLNLPWII